jgi:mannosyl-3-phosphoglycerate phosphatase
MTKPLILTDQVTTPDLLIFTDLDGTLLDHHDYNFAPAQETIKSINKLGVVWILNTSKTLAELLTLRETLNNQHPMIVENGGGIAIPIGYPLTLPAQLNRTLDKSTSDLVHQGFQLITMGERRQHILDILKPLRAQFTFTGFNDMSTAELVKLTSLSTTQAEQALQRDFSEPIIWQDSEEKFEQFRQLVTGHSLRLLKGGRFIHVIGNSDKGIAMRWLAALYHQTRPELKTVALGDGENDIAMLEEADIPVIIRSPAHNPPPVQRENTVLTQGYGPSGWSQALQALLKN